MSGADVAEPLPCWRGTNGSGIDRKRVDAVEASRVVMEGETLLTGATNAPAWRRSGWQPEVRQDAPGHLSIFDHRDQAHGTGASGASEDVEAERPLHQDGPRKAPRSVGIIGASKFRCYRPVTLGTCRLPGRVTDRARCVNSLL